jgi:O-antigen/teichoic acid export membrane protein
VQESLKKRYFAKLSTNLVSLIISLVVAVIVPRALGPKNYGDFNFLTNYMNQIIPFLTFGTSIGFFTKLSQRQNEFGLVSFFSGISFIGISTLFLFIYVSNFTGLSSTLWINQEQSNIYKAALFASLMWGVSTISQVTDAYGITISVEIAKIIIKFISIIALVLLFYSNLLTLSSFFSYNYVVFSLTIIASTLTIVRCKKDISFNWILSKVQFKAYLNEFYQYSSPLFLYSTVGLIIGVFDIWILQKFGGSEQQGYFGLSFQVGALCFIFTSAMTPLITREFSIAFSENNRQKMSELFHQYIPMLYSLAAYFCAFISITSEDVIQIFGGEEYANAKLAMMIMAFYPIHQTYGQLSGSVFYASGNTKIYRNIGLTFMVLGLPVVFYLIAPTSFYGLNLGATGLAIKFVLIQVIAVNVQLHFNAKFLNIELGYFLKHQVVSVLVLIALSYIADYSISYLNYFNNVIVSFILKGLLYTTLVGLTAWYKPTIYGIERHVMDALKFKVKSKFIKWKKSLKK